MNKQIKLFLGVVGIFLLVLVGCTGSASSATSTQIPMATVAPDELGGTVVTTEESLVLLEVVLYPGKGMLGLEYEKGDFGLGSFNWEEGAQVDLPEGYRLPQWVFVNETRGGKSFQLLIGPGDLPVQPDRIVYLSLSEEIRVPITQEGLTQVIFHEEPPPCGEK